MDQKEKIKFMISSLQVALDELEYAEKYETVIDSPAQKIISPLENDRICPERQCRIDGISSGFTP